jgi:hypothetical protein
MKTRYTITENQLLSNLLESVPKGIAGSLPYKELAKKPEWVTLKKQHGDLSIRTALQRAHKKSVLSVKPKGELNHAYNFCPGCGLKLNS